MIKEYFKLDKFGNPAKVPKSKEWVTSMADSLFLACSSFDVGDTSIHIKTYFTGQDWNTGKEKHVPYLWETSIKGTDLIPEQRYQTQAGALEGHVEACRRAMFICMAPMGMESMHV